MQDLLQNLRKMAQHPYVDKVHEAGKDVHPNPTEKQREAGNYRSGHVHIHGLNITIETAKGQIRKKKDWSRKMHAHYGYIRNTSDGSRAKAGDGENIDVFIGEHPESQLVFVVRQLKKDGSFDEYKVVLGELNAKAAKELYLSHYPENWTGFGGIEGFFMPRFKKWLYTKKTEKKAELKPEVVLQPHQQRLYEEAKKEPIRKLLYMTLGSGKGGAGLAAAEAQNQPYTAVVPASLRPTWNQERAKFTTQDTPADILSYSEVSRGQPVTKLHTLIADEAHRLRNPGSKQTQHFLDLANKADQLLLLTGTPVTNRPGDIAPLLSALTKKNITPKDFTQRYVGTRTVSPGFLGYLLGAKATTEPALQRSEELKALLRGHVDYYSPEKPLVGTDYETHEVDMGVNQSRLYRAMWDQLPWLLKWKLRRNYPLSDNEFRRALSFLTGPRQVGLSTYPFQKSKNPLKAFNESPKLQRAHELMQQELKDERKKGVVFSNFIDAGLVPYAAALEKAKTPFGVFHGGLSDEEKKKLVKDYNRGDLRVLLLGPSGSEGLSLKGTNIMQILDPHYHAGRGRQAIGRAIRFDSHTDLPEDLRNVKVQRFTSKLPLGFKDRLLASLGVDRSKSRLASDDYLSHMSEQKDIANKAILNLLKEVGTQKKSEAPAELVVQEKKHSCGPAALKSVIAGLGYGTKDEKTLRNDSGSNPKNGTPPFALAATAEKHGIKVMSFGPMTLDGLGKATAEGNPVIVTMQSTDDPEDGWNGGHYIVVTKRANGKINYMDPANGESRSLPENEFSRRWHDIDGNKKKYINFGMVLSGMSPEKKGEASALLSNYRFPIMDLYNKLGGHGSSLDLDDIHYASKRSEAVTVFPEIQTKEAKSPVIDLLRQAKVFSDARHWSGKQGIILNLMSKNPKDWVVDQDLGEPFIGVKHKSGFRFHMPRHLIPENIMRLQPVLA